jgi:peptide/nickel transport system substrate-binding protein
MGDKNQSASQKGMNRRKFLAGVGAGAAASVAGCTGGPSGTPTPRVETVVETREVTDTPTGTPRARGDSSGQMFNPMGYTGADEFINEQAAMMDPEPRKPIVKNVLATIWNDAPTKVMFYDKVLHALNEDWEGWIPTVGGPVHADSNLNIRPTSGASRDRPIIGMDTAPNSLNVLSSSTAYAFQIMDNIYTYGTALHPTTFEFIGAGYESWELNPDNVGTSEPTITATLRDDLVFNDGTPVTAEDPQFSAHYIVEQGAAGSIAASQFSSLAGYEDNAIEGNGITVDDAEGRTVNYFLTEQDNAWFTSILGSVFLPKHIWQDVSDYQQYTPRNSSEGIVGSGPFVLSDFSWEEWFELELRDEGVWEPDAEYADYLDDGAPFIDAVRYEIFGSQTALQQAALDRSIDAMRGGVTVDTAVEATNTDGIEVLESEDSGWSHTSWNVRRVPLDDRAFRQFLVKLFDDTWIIEDLKQGLGGRRGSYVTPYAYQEWRPPEPWDADSHEGIPLPDLEFPGSQGSFQLGQSGIEEARNWLANHSDAAHDYTWEEADVGGHASPDNLVLHVNGDPFPEAHTDNFGEPGQGPLEVSFNPPQEDVDEARILQRWTGAVRRVGIPTNNVVQSFNSQLPKVYANEDFDVFAMGWVNINVNNDHFAQLFGSPGADLGY